MAAMIETLKQLCIVLSEEQVTVQDVGSHLGKLVSDEGGSLPLIIQPDDTAFAKAEIVRDYETQAPAHVELTLADSTALSVSDITAVFGHYRQIPKMQPKTPTRIMFSFDESGKPYTCALIANLVSGASDQATVTSVIVRRDMRLA